MKTSDLFVRCLENEGVEYIFGVPGEENADMMMSLLNSKICFVVCRHEQGAAFMADAYGRLTGKPAVCLGTLGPGATNLLTGVADANMDRVPLVVVTGQGSTARLHKESHQVMDVVSMFRPVVKWTVSVINADSVPEVVRKAFKIACTEKMGATHIEFPEDVAKHRTLAQPLSPETNICVQPNPDLIERAAELLQQADFPVILAGNGVLRDRASKALTDLVEKTGIPVVNTFMGKGAIPASNPRSLFTVGLQSRDFVAEALEHADVVLVVGYDMVEYDPRLWNRGCNKKIINVDFVPAEVDAAFEPTVDITANIGVSLLTLRNTISDDMPCIDPARYVKYRTVMEKDFSQHANDTGFPLKPQKILWEVRRVMDANDILLSDVGAHKMWIARYYQCDGPNTCLISNGFCTMGFALPGSIGAKLSHPGCKVLSISGDGGIMMNIQDLETAVRLHLPIVAMVWTDSQYGLIKWKQQARFGKVSHIDFSNPDFVKLAEAFGAIGMRVERADELSGLLNKAFEQAERSKVPVLIDCPVDYSENMKLSRRLGEIPSAERTSLLKNVPIFADVEKSYIEIIADYMDERNFASGETLCTEGEDGREVYLIVEGSAEIQVKGAAGKPSCTQTVGPGSCVGEMAVLADQPRSATVVAGADGLRTLVLSASDFQEILLTQPEIGIQLLKVLSNRFGKK